MVIVAALMLSLALFACGDDDDDDSGDGAGDDDDDNDDTAADDDDDNDDNNDDEWTPVEPHVEIYEGWQIVWLAGSAYDMGHQQGTMLHAELGAGIDWLDQYHLIDILLPIARLLGLIDMAVDNSYPDTLAECRGLSDAAGDVGFTMEVCLLMNFGDVLVEFLGEGFPPALRGPGCTQVAAAGDATVDGRLYHARGLDWSKIDYLLDYPVIFVRQPDDGIPHTFIGFPGNLSPYSGMNAAGVTVASNEADPLNNTVHDRYGRSHVQMQAMLLKTAGSLQEAQEFILAQDHMTVETIVVADAVAGEAAAFEMTGVGVGVRPLEQGVVVATNHFVAPETEDLDAEPAGASSLRRFTRATQLCGPDGDETHWGEIDPGVLISVLRDRVNPDNGETTPPGVFDNDESIATNGAIYQMVFSGEDLCFWVSGGEIPVPEQTFVGFSLGELLELPDAVAVDPLFYE